MTIHSSILQVKDDSNEKIILISVLSDKRITLSIYEDRAPTATEHVGAISFTFDELFEKIKREDS